MHASLLRTCSSRIAQKPSSTGEPKFRVIADQQRLVRRSSERKLTRNDRSSARPQRLLEVLGILHKHQVIARRRGNTSHPTNLDSAVSAQPRPDSLCDLLQRAPHALHCIAAGRADESSGRYCSESKLVGEPATAVRCRMSNSYEPRTTGFR